MQVVEDVEEGFLRPLGLACPELDVVDDKDVNEFVEVDEVVGGAGTPRLSILLHELLAGDVENGLVGMQFLGFQSDGVGQMGLPEAHTAVEQQGVEGGEARFLGYSVAGRARQAVAVALNKVLQRVVGTQLRVDSGFLDAGDDEGVGDFARVSLININGQVREGVLHRGTSLRG